MAIGTTTIAIMFFTFLTATIMVIGFLLYDYLTYNYVVRLKEVVNGRLIIRTSRAKEVKDKDGTIWLKVKKYLKTKKPLPPNDCIDLQQALFRTIKTVDMYVLTGGNVRYAKDNYVDQEGYTPITSNDRSALVNQIKKAEEEEGKLDWNKVQTLISIAAIVIIVLFGYFTFQDTNEKHVIMSANNLEASKNFKDAAQSNADAVNGIQRIRAEESIKPAQNDPVTLGDPPAYNN